MKKIIALTIFLLLFLISCLPAPRSLGEVGLFVKPAHAWSRQQLTFTNDFTGWNEIGKYQPSVLIENGIFKMWFTTYDGTTTKIGYATSPNGTTWVNHGPVFTSAELNIHDPTVMRDVDGYTMWFAADYPNTPGIKIYRATSSDGISWQMNPATPVLVPTNGSWDADTVTSPFVIKEGNSYKMWFTGHGQNWSIGQATSQDGIVWEKHSSNPLLDSADGASIMTTSNGYEMYYQRYGGCGYGIYKVESNDGLLWLGTSNPEQVACTLGSEDNLIIAPAAVKNNTNTYVYFTGISTEGKGDLFLVTNSEILVPSITPTPSTLPTPTLGASIPTPTPTLTLAPTTTSIQDIIPIIIIPGFMASWNKEAILHNQTVDYSAWKLQNFVKEYDGLINTLKNTGYQQNVNLFLFPYDWRQSIEKTTNDLNNYLQAKIWNNKPNQKINIVGHSLGGLVGRIFTQKNKDKINRTISVGSPHQGLVQVYKPLEAGEIDRENTFLWLAEKIILILNKSTLENDRVTVANKFPVAKDIFPTFNFLKDVQGNEMAVNSLTIKNSFLDLYNQNFSEIFPVFSALYGETSSQTPAGFIIQPADTVNQLLGNYLDGQPKSTLFNDGDYTVLSKSANQDSDAEKLDFGHREIITKKVAIKRILSLLNISFSDDQIVEGQVTKISSSLIFMIKSPAVMTVKFNDKIYTEDEGIIFIPNAQSGSYSLKVQGTDQGKYEIVIGQIAENNDIWESVDGEINQSPASSQIDDYSINYDNQTALQIFLTPTITPTATVTMTPILTGQINLSPMATLTPSSAPTTTPQPSPEILGISSHKEGLITPMIEVAKQAKPKKEIKNSFNIWDYIWPSLTSLMLGGMGYLLRKKILKK